MSIIVCGSLAYDTLLTFPDRFARHLLPDQLHKLSVCFLVPELRREYGGCAGNIAYNLALLGGEPLIVSAAGEDFGPYRAHLAQHGIRTDGIYEAPGRHTAQCFITSDRDDNQITLVEASGEEAWPRLDKQSVAQRLAERIAGHFAAGGEG